MVVSEPYGWVADQPALALTLVRGVDEAAVVRAFGGDPARVRPDTAGCLSEDRWADQYADFVDVDVDSSELLAEDRAHLWVNRVGEWLLVTEDNGFRGTDPDVIAALGAQVHACVMWNAGVGVNFVYAEQGVVEAAFRDFIGTAYGEHPERLRSWAEGLRLDLYDDLGIDEDALLAPAHQRALVMLERATGVALGRAHVAARQLHFTVPEQWRAGIGGSSVNIVTFDATSEPLQKPAGFLNEFTIEDQDRQERIRLTLSQARNDAESLRYVPTAWLGAPRDVLPAVVPVEQFVGRSEQAFVWLRALAVYPSGVTLEIDARARQRTLTPAEALGASVVDASGRVSDRSLRLAVELADGQRATNLATYHGETPPSRPVLHSTGTILGTEQHYWLWPLPPVGPLLLTCRWPAYGIGRSELQLDATAIRAAAGRSQHAWIT